MKSKRREGDGMVEGVLGKELGGFAEWESFEQQREWSEPWRYLKNSIQTKKIAVQRPWGWSLIGKLQE